MNIKITMIDGKIFIAQLTNIDETGITGITSEYVFFYSWRDIKSIEVI
jgi:hypothetical protein